MEVGATETRSTPAPPLLSAATPRPGLLLLLIVSHPHSSQPWQQIPPKLNTPVGATPVAIGLRPGEGYQKRKDWARRCTQFRLDSFLIGAGRERMALLSPHSPHPCINYQTKASVGRSFVAVGHMAGEGGQNGTDGSTRHQSRLSPPDAIWTDMAIFPTPIAAETPHGNGMGACGGNDGRRHLEWR